MFRVALAVLGIPVRIGCVACIDMPARCPYLRPGNLMWRTGKL